MVLAHTLVFYNKIISIVLIPGFSTQWYVWISVDLLKASLKSVSAQVLLSPYLPPPRTTSVHTANQGEHKVVSVTWLIQVLYSNTMGKTLQLKSYIEKDYVLTSAKWTHFKSATRKQLKFSYSVLLICVPIHWFMKWFSSSLIAVPVL